MLNSLISSLELCMTPILIGCLINYSLFNIFVVLGFFSTVMYNMFKSVSDRQETIYLFPTFIYVFIYLFYPYIV